MVSALGRPLVDHWGVRQFTPLGGVSRPFFAKKRGVFVGLREV